MPPISSRRDLERLPIAFQRSRPLSQNSNSAATMSGNGNNNSAAPALAHNCKVDRFGFITNMDANGRLVSAEGKEGQGGAPEAVGDIESDSKRIERREKKWSSMMNTWDTTNRRRHKLVLNRLRKGLPDSMRHKVWPLLGGVNKKMRPGSSTNRIYKELLEQCEEDNQNALDHLPPEGPNKSLARMTSAMRSNSFQNIQETIERDIHRTYPRHSLFYDEENHKDDAAVAATQVASEEPNQQKEGSAQSETTDEDDDDDGDDDDDDSQAGLGGLCNEDLSTLMMELEVGTSPFKKKPPKKKKSPDGGQLSGSSHHSSRANSNTSSKSATKAKTPVAVQAHPGHQTVIESMMDIKGGQGALRRVLCAYSYYDREVGYCQGMNFIAAMFITIMPEKEAFWMLVATMHDNPCHLRGLFGKGMTETHKVLHVAEKLIHHFLPKLAKHLDKENVHVTMYATQWLLTQYTSSFHFDLVTRVWDCFLVEGFKTIYRVMLALLQQAQPTLLKMSFEEILGFFKAMPDQVDGNTVMETAMKIPLKRKHIKKYESEWKASQEESSN